MGVQWTGKYTRSVLWETQITILHGLQRNVCKSVKLRQFGTFYIACRSDNVCNLNCACWCSIVCMAPSYICHLVAENPGRRHLYAQLCVAILLFQLHGQSATVLAASLSQDRPHETLCRYRYAPASDLSILIPSWAKNGTVHQSVSLARSWLFV